MFPLYRNFIDWLLLWSMFYMITNIWRYCFLPSFWVFIWWFFLNMKKICWKKMFLCHLYICQRDVIGYTYIYSAWIIADAFANIYVIIMPLSQYLHFRFNFYIKMLYLNTHWYVWRIYFYHHASLFTAWSTLEVFKVWSASEWCKVLNWISMVKHIFHNKNKKEKNEEVLLLFLLVLLILLILHSSLLICKPISTQVKTSKR